PHQLRLPMPFHIEQITATGVHGWAFLPDHKDLSIEATLAGRLIGRTSPGISRPDVARHFPDVASSKNCGFKMMFDLPQDVWGPQQIEVFSIANGQRTKLGEKLIMRLSHVQIREARDALPSAPHTTPFPADITSLVAAISPDVQTDLRRDEDQ